MSEPGSSPTTTITRVLIVEVVGLVLAVLLGARGIVHAGEGMPDGPARDVTLAVGIGVLGLAERASLSWPWDSMEAALGRDPQPSLPPLLAASHAGSRPLHASRSPRARRPPRAARHLLQRPGRPRDVRVWIPTRAHPLRLLVTGDSLVGILGPLLVNEASRVAPIDGVHLTDAGAQVVSDEVLAVLKRDWHV